MTNEKIKEKIIIIFKILIKIIVRIIKEIIGIPIVFFVYFSKSFYIDHVKNSKIFSDEMKSKIEEHHFLKYGKPGNPVFLPREKKDEQTTELKLITFFKNTFFLFVNTYPFFLLIRVDFFRQLYII